MFAFRTITVFCSLVIILTSSLSFSTEVGGRITSDETWSPAGNPYHISENVIVGARAVLTIEPGVIVQLDMNGNIQVEGKIIAQGTEQDSIVFTSTRGRVPGAWGSLIFSGQGASMDFLNAFRTDSTEEVETRGEEGIWDRNWDYEAEGSVFEYCRFEYGGNPGMFTKATFDVKFSNLRISHSTIKNCMGETGTIQCGNVSNVHIENSVITNNQALRGGAVSVGVGAKAVLKGNRILYNVAEQNGGAVYVSLGEATLIDNLFIENDADGSGGAIYAARSDHFWLDHNVFDQNYCQTQETTIYITEAVNATLRNNAFDAISYAIYLDKAETPIDAAENWWKRPDIMEPKSVFWDQLSYGYEPPVNYNPPLYAPPENLITNPKDVTLIQLCRDEDYEREIPHGVGDGTIMRIRLDATDTNPLAQDQIQIKVVSERSPEGIVIPLKELAEQPGVFVGRGKVAVESNQSRYHIGDIIGGEITLFAPFQPGFKKSYEVMDTKPLADNFQIPFTESLQNVVDHHPRFTWDYFDLADRPQSHLRMRVFELDGSGNPIDPPHWDTDAQAGSAHNTCYAGPDLIDGTGYQVLLQVYNEDSWSDPAKIEFRMNSEPTAPTPLTPNENELVNTLQPEIVIGKSIDPEGDELKYSFELSRADLPDAPSQSLKSVASEDDEISWTPDQFLMENQHYHFRALAADPYESGPWSDYREFWVNAEEEHPTEFDLSAPVNNVTIYDLHPEFTWVQSSDPDPLSSIAYTLEVSETEEFSSPYKFEGIDSLSFKIPTELKNRTTYYWRITAVDNTDRTTLSSSVGQFYIDTTPSIPQAIFPGNGEERLPADKLSWVASTDPDPADSITYEIEILDKKTAGSKIAWVENWGNTEIAVNELTSWDNLQDNTIYYWRIRAWDNHAADSKYSKPVPFFYNLQNDPPARILTITEPFQDTLTTTNVKFTWTPATDPDLSDPSGSLIYEIETVVGDYATGDVRKFETPTGEISYTTTLDDNRMWSFRIRARDDEGAVGEWTKVDSVLVNVQEDPPTLFTLLKPASGSAIAELDSITFTWESSSDPDWRSSIEYRLEIYENDAPRYEITLPETTFTFYEGLKNETAYRWNVIAVDNTNLETKAQSEHFFRTSTTPTAPQMVVFPDELLPNENLSFKGATDPNPEDFLTYTVMVSDNANFMVPQISVQGIEHGSDTISVQINSLEGEENLEDDKDYYFRVQAVDNHGYAGEFTQPQRFRFNRQNDNPQVPPSPYSPTGGNVLRAQVAKLEWGQAADEDLSDPHHTLRYQILLKPDGDYPVIQPVEYRTETGVTEFMLPEGLVDNTPWIWQVRTEDDEAALSEWSPKQRILINVQEDPPSAPQLTAPTPDQKFNILGPIGFSWQPSTDIDHLSYVKYRLEYSEDEAFSDILKVENIDAASAVVEGPLKNIDYYWRVAAIDNTGLETISAVNRFTLDTRPSVPVTVTPSNEAEMLPDAEFSWNAATDPNQSDIITYSLRINSGDQVGSEVITKRNISSTSITFPEIGWNGNAIVHQFGDNQVFNWQIKSMDNHGIESEYSAAQTFIFNARNDYPLKVSSITAPADGAELPTVSLSWEAPEDPDPTDLAENIAYEVELSMNEAFTGETRTIEVAQGITTVKPMDLQDDSEWFWRVRARDNEDAVGDFSDVHRFVYNSRNDPPRGVPGLTSPADGSEVSDINLTWVGASDVDLSDPVNSLKYQIEFCRESGFTSDIRKYETQPGETTFSTSDLEDNVKWFWRVRTVDDDGAGSEYSEIRSFFHNRGNDAPLAVGGLTSPPNGNEVTTVNLSWQPASDNDPLDPVESLSYVVELSTNENFRGDTRQVETAAGITETSVNDLTDNTVWYWRVSAKDDEGQIGAASQAGTFILNQANDNPQSVGSLVSPIDREEVGSVLLVWKAAIDPDPTDPAEKISYEVEFATDQGFTENKALKKTQPGKLELSVNDLADNTLWYWRVRPVDDEGATGPYSPIESFVINQNNEPPMPPAGLVSPEEGAVVTEVLFEWQAGSDPDFSHTPDKLKYEIELSTRDNFSRNNEILETDSGVTTFDTRRLDDNSIWYWRVFTVDPQETRSAPTEMRSFVYNRENDNPEEFELIRPEALSVFRNTRIRFRWESTDDVDPGDGVTYKLRIARDQDFNIDVHEYDVGNETDFEPPEDIYTEDGEYFWQVVAEDRHGGKTFGSDSDRRPPKILLQRNPAGTGTNGN